MFEKSKCKNNEDKLLISKIIDKYKYCQTKNKIVNTDFLNIAQISLIKKFLIEENIKNYIFYGARENADREILIFYPEKFSINIVKKNYEKILNIIRINLNCNVKYEHREYLSGIMKLGIKREKIGDIIVTQEGADIVVLSEVCNYLQNGLKDLTRFRKSEIIIENIKNVKQLENEFECFNIIVSSNRLDNFVTALAKCSRKNSCEMIKQGKIFINSINEFKEDKKIKLNDIITIRGKGKFIFDNIEKCTKSGKLLLNIRKYR